MVSERLSLEQLEEWERLANASNDGLWREGQMARATRALVPEVRRLSAENQQLRTQQHLRTANQAQPVQFDPEYEIAWTNDRAPKSRHRKTRNRKNCV